MHNDGYTEMYRLSFLPVSEGSRQHHFHAGHFPSKKTICMRNRLIAFLLLTAILFQHPCAASESNPFSRFSTQWDEPIFHPAKPIVQEFVNPAEREFLHMINLVRISPRLFSETILLPYARKNGKLGQASIFLHRSNLVYNLRSIQVSLFHNYVASLQLHSMSQAKDTAVDGIGQLSALARSDVRKFAWKRTQTGDPLEILLQMLVDDREIADPLLEMLLGKGNTAGIVIREKKENTFVTAIVSDTMSMEQALKMNMPDLCDYNTMEPISFLEFKRDTTDLFLKILCDRYPDVKDPVYKLVDEAEYARIKDSAVKNHLSIEDKSFKHTLHIEGEEMTDPQSYINYSHSDLSYKTRSGDVHYGDDAEQPIFIYYLNRQTSPCKNSMYFKIGFMRSLEPFMPYPPDSIGRINPANIDFSKVDSFASSLRVEDTRQLANKLTRPFATEMEKVRSIFVWMDRNFSYDHEGLKNNTVDHDVEKLLKKRKAVCQGYSNVFSFLCNQSGIRSFVVTGYSLKKVDSLGHAWNMVNINKQWYLLDVTGGMSFFLEPPEEFIIHHLPSYRQNTLLQRPLTWQEWNDLKVPIER